MDHPWSPGGAKRELFRNAGVGFFGPLLVKERRGEVKAYRCLFTCMSTRACHLELVDDLSTDHFIMALKRFIARRGRSQRIHSDNETSFVGANNELRKCIEQLDEERIQNFCAPKEIELKFHPPSAPHFGGAWGRLVQCTSKTLTAILDARFFFDLGDDRVICTLNVNSSVRGVQTTPRTFSVVV